MEVIWKRTRALPFLAALLALGCYALTRAPSVTEIDSGELAAVAATFGIAHPPGYALWTLLAGAFARLPLLDSVVARTNLFSGVCAAGAALAAGLAARALAGELAALAGVLLAAGSATLWSVATVTEVYALHALLVALALWLSAEAARRGSLGWSLGAAAALGAGVTHHLSAVCAVPAALALLHAGLGRRLWRALPALSGAALLAALLPLAWLPLRAAGAPLVAWGEPGDLERLWAHVTGAQYRVFYAESAGAYFANLGRAARLLATDLTPLGLLLALLGARALGRRALPLALLALVNLALTAGYGIKDLDPYFLPSLLALAILAAAGLARLAERLGARRWLLALAALVPLAWNYAEHDRSRDTFVRDYALSVIDALPPGAVLLTKHYDAILSPAWYFQFAEGRRRDVVLVDPEMVRRSWYKEVFARQHPEEAGWVRAAWEEFALAVRPFERGQPHDPAALERLWRAVCEGLVHGALSRGRAAFVGPDLAGDFGQLLAWVPDGLVFRVFPALPSAAARPPPPLADLDLARRSADLATVQAAQIWLDMTASAAAYEAARGRCAAARIILEPVARRQPRHPGAARVAAACRIQPIQ